jgi:L-asparagine transporter-like permease
VSAGTAFLLGYILGGLLGMLMMAVLAASRRDDA